MIQRVLWWETQKRCSSRKKQGPMTEEWCYNKILMNFLISGKTREDKRMVKLDFFSFQNFPFWTYMKKKPTHAFLGAWSFLFIQIWFTPSEGPKFSANWFIRKLDVKAGHEVGLWKMIFFNGPTSWSMV